MFYNQGDFGQFVDLYVQEQKNQLIQLSLSKYTNEELMSLIDEMIHSKILNRYFLLEFLDCLPKFKSINLIFNSLIHGNKPSDFHKYCDGILGTLILIRSGCFIAGVYTDQDWQGDHEIKKSNNTFLFSINKKRIYTIKNPEQAIYCAQEYLPIVGGFVIRW